MITIYNLSRKAFTSILNVMPTAITDVGQDYGTVTVTLNGLTDIDTCISQEYVTVKNGMKFVHIKLNELNYIKIS